MRGSGTRTRGTFHAALKLFIKYMTGAPKPVEASIEVENAVPIAGLERDFNVFCVANSNVQITLVRAGRRLLFTGWIESVNGENATQSAASLSFTVVAGKPDIL